MIYPSPDKLDQMGSKYALVIVAAKRARQIRENARKLTSVESKNPLTIALHEIAEGAIIPLQTGEPEPIIAPAPPTPVIGGLVLESLQSESEAVEDDLLADIRADDKELDAAEAEEEAPLGLPMDLLDSDTPFVGSDEEEEASGVGIVGVDETDE